MRLQIDSKSCSSAPHTMASPFWPPISLSTCRNLGQSVSIFGRMARDRIGRRCMSTLGQGHSVDFEGSGVFVLQRGIVAVIQLTFGDPGLSACSRYCGRRLEAGFDDPDIRVQAASATKSHNIHVAGVLRHQQPVLADGTHAIRPCKRLRKLELDHVLRLAVRLEINPYQLVLGDAVDIQYILFAERQPIGPTQYRVLGRDLQLLSSGLEHHDAALPGVGNVRRSIAGYGNIVAERSIAGKRVAALGGACLQIEGFHRGRIAGAIIALVGADPQRLEFLVRKYAVYSTQAIGSGFDPLGDRGGSVRYAANVSLAHAADQERAVLRGSNALGV